MNISNSTRNCVDRRFLDIVILGGGTAGWMTAAALSKVMRGRCRVELVESDEIGSVGVGEATIPMIHRYNDLLGLNEDEFVRQTQATFKLGIEFTGWNGPGSRYLHGFGHIGQDLWTLPFDQYWRRMRIAGQQLDMGEYSIAHMAVRQNKFMRPPKDIKNSPLNDIAYAFHMDATLYARYLRQYAEARGVIRTEGKVVDVARHSEDGFITHLQLTDGRKVSGDLFIDCSGLQSVLLGKTLGVAFESWQHWLPCDAALAVPSSGGDGPLLPYTKATVRPHGWQWRIPLQHRVGNGYVFSSQHVSVDEATSILLNNLDGRPLADPRLIRFCAGMRKVSWSHNCIAVGLSSGFLEPLESTSIHLIQQMIARLMMFFPDRCFASRDMEEFNKQARVDYERVRDFIILHYHATNGTTGDFWRYCQTMTIPETLSEQIALYRTHGRLFRAVGDLFGEGSWLQVLEGQGITSSSYHPLADLPDESVVVEYLTRVRDLIARCVAVMPDHAQFIAQHCAAKTGTI